MLWLTNVLLPDGTEPLPEPMLIYYVFVVLAWEQFHKNP